MNIHFLAIFADDLAESEKRVREELDVYIFSTIDIQPIRDALAELVLNDSKAGAQSVLRVLASIAAEAAENSSKRKAMRTDAEKLMSGKSQPGEAEARRLDVRRQSVRLLDLRQRRLDSARVEVLFALSSFKSQEAIGALVESYRGLADADARTTIALSVSASKSPYRIRWIAALRAANETHLKKGK